MKVCLHCNKEFENKKETAKFCSVSHRVMWNRENKNKPKGVTEKQRLEVLYNLILELVGNAKSQTFQQKQADFIFSGTPTNTLMAEEPLNLSKPIVPQSDSFEFRIRKCRTVEEIKKVVDEVKDTDLPYPVRRKLTDLAKEVSKDFYND